MNGPVLVGVHDSPAAFAAAEAAIEYARRSGAALRAVAVVAHDGEADPRESALAQERERVCSAALAHVAKRAADEGVTAQTTLRHGRVAAGVLAEAAACHASIIVLGRMDRPGPVIPAIGSHTLGIIEFAHVPVLVVPDDGAMKG